MSGLAFQDKVTLRAVAHPLLRTWGYHFYGEVSQMRADDLLVRQQVGGLLGQARKWIEKAEQEFRKEKLPPPSREHPRHNPQSLQQAQTLEQLSRRIGALQGRIQGQMPIETDVMREKFRAGAEIMRQFLEWDEILAAQAELLRSLLERKSGGWILQNRDELEAGLDAMEESLRQRQSVFSA